MSALGERTVLAVDPGSAKCGLALVHRDPGGKLHILWRAVCATADLVEQVRAGLAVATPAMLVVGGGTRSRRIVSTLKDAFPNLGLLVANEENTSVQARERYWEHHPRRGLRRLLPASMQPPPVPYDDFAALVLAERVLTD